MALSDPFIEKHIRPRSILRRRLRRFIPAFIVALMSGLWVFWLGEIAGDHALRLSLTGRWFQSDAWRVYDDMVRYEASHYRNSIRPLFSVIAIPFTNTGMWVFGLNEVQAIRLLQGTVSALIGWFMYFLLLRMRAGCLGAVLGSVFLMITAATIYWQTIPETFGLGSVVMVATLCLASKARVSLIVLSAAGVLCTGILLSNGMAACVAAWVRRSFEDALDVAFVCAVGFVLCWGVQKLMFEKPAALFLGLSGADRGYILNPEQGGPLRSLAVLSTHSVIAPEPQLTLRASPQGLMLSAQHTRVVTDTLLATAAYACWLVLVTTGLAAALMRFRELRVIRLAAMLLLGQYMLHSVYGEESILYVMHVMPPLCLLALAALSLRRRYRWLVQGWLILTTILLALYNVGQWSALADVPFEDAHDERIERLYEGTGVESAQQTKVDQRQSRLNR
ncbi:MAG: hypothetical protein RLN76_10770 [Phycisphaeraceae bacterium]